MAKMGIQMRIYYGHNDYMVDVTEFAITKCIDHNNILHIPITDSARSDIFTDVAQGILKHIRIIYQSENEKYIEEYSVLEAVYLRVKVEINEDDEDGKMLYLVKNLININNQWENRLYTIQNQTEIRHGNFREEFPEQCMSARYIKPDSRVLEIGGNIGRNSLVISKMVKDSRNLVVMECDEGIAEQLRENRDLNNLQFEIENSALSSRSMIQKGWDTLISDDLLPGYKRVNTTTYTELRNKYPIEFDTLVVDCEGSFYYILQDFPQILINIKTIIMENDYHDIEHKNSVDQILRISGFVPIYQLRGGWGPCSDFFFETWKKLE